MGRKIWTEEDIERLEQLYKDGKSFEEIASLMGRTVNAINSKSYELKLGYKYMRTNNPNFKAMYQDYDWCYERYINRGMTHREMADEAGCKLRVMQKWCVEKFGLHEEYFRGHKQLTNLQKQVIMFGRLGDGHIDKRETQPMYIESHAEDEKEYLYWKYDILKDLCNKEPSIIPAYDKVFNGKVYHCQNQYRLNTKILDALYEIRSMSRLEIILQLTELGLVLHLLDDGHRESSNWELCVAEYSDEEISNYLRICKDKFNLIANKLKDNRYIIFDAVSSRTIDSMILSLLPNNLDIIKKKILNRRICAEANYIYVICNDGSRMGVSAYYRSKKQYRYMNEMYQVLLKNNIQEINEDELEYYEKVLN